MRIGIRRNLPRGIVLALGCATVALGQGVRITEFLAVNRDGLRDEDGDATDWLELQNRSGESVDLSGWFLTDSADHLRRWEVPDGVRLAPGEVRIVFASGKNRRDPGAQLHTDFELAREGEFLALVRPDGETVEHGYAPAYPRQTRDVSYGLRQEVEEQPLVTPRTPARLLANEPPPENWHSLSFDASEWTSARAGVGHYGDPEAARFPPAGTNLALRGVATQSSTEHGGSAERAIDGNTDGIFSNGSVAYTAHRDESPFWQVDLGDAYFLDHIVLWNRTDWCAGKIWNRKIDNCLESLTNFRLSVSAVDADGHEMIIVANDHFTDQTTFERQAYRVNLPPSTRGQIVRIEKLGPNRRGVFPFSIAEVEVLAAAPPRRPWIAHEIPRQRRKSSHACLRVAVARPHAAAEDLTLRMRFDAGFVAYLNGRQVARQNMDPGALTSQEPRAEAQVSRVTTIPLSELLPELFKRPDSVLALRGVNSEADDPGFLLAPELVARVVRDGEPGYFVSPTPEELNTSAAVDGFLDKPSGSPQRGFYQRPFVVTLSGASPSPEGYSIRYTLDGSLPSETGGHLYRKPIRVSSTTVLRAAAFRRGWAPSDVLTRTYIFANQVPHQKGESLPRTWDRRAARYAFNPAAFHDGTLERVVDGLRRLPTLSIVLPPDDLYGERGIYRKSLARGRDWERACSLEWLDPRKQVRANHKDGFQIDCGLRIFGFSSRNPRGSAKHSLRLVFKRRYGPAKLRFPFFPEWPDRNVFDDIVLRAGSASDPRGPRRQFRYCQHLRDAFARYTARDMKKLTTASTHVHVYLNGLYWGVYNAVERPDAEFMVQRFQGEREDYDALNARVGLIEVVDGSQAGWDALMRLSLDDVSSEKVYAEILRRVEVTDLIDYNLLNFYLGSEDWPGAGRQRTGNNMRVAGSRDHDVPFHSFVWDMENTLRNVERNSVQVQTHKDTPATLYSRLLANPSFRKQVSARVRRHFRGRGALTPTRSAKRWRHLLGSVGPALPAEWMRWGDDRRRLTTTRQWQEEQRWLLESYFPRRTRVVLRQLRDAGVRLGK